MNIDNQKTQVHQQRQVHTEQKDDDENCQWIKAEYNQRTKRIFNPPATYDGLVKTLRVRFKDLDARMQQLESNPKICWRDPEGDLISVESDTDLSEALVFAKKEMSPRILKFLIDTYEGQNARKELKENVEQDLFELCQSAISIEGDQYEALNQSELSQKEEIEHEKVNVGDLSDENVDQEKVDVVVQEEEVQLRIQDKQQIVTDIVSDLVEQSSVLQENENKIQVQEEEKQPSDALFPPKPIEVVDEFGAVILSEVVPRLSLSCEYSMMLCGEHDVEPEGNTPRIRKSSLIDRIKVAFLNKPVELCQLSVVIGPRECYIQAEPGQTVTVSWAIQNQSERLWPSSMILTNQCLTDAYIQPLKVTQRLSPNDMLRLEVKVKLPEDCKNKNKVLLAFAFQDEDHDEIGERMFAIIELIQPYERSAFEDSILDESEQPLNYSPDHEFLYGVASELNEEGYGNFNRCLRMLKACKGDTEEAKKALSNLVFEEFL